MLKLEVSHQWRVQWASNVEFRPQSSPLTLGLAPNKTLLGCQDFVYQLRRGGLRIRTQQRLGSRSAEQDPRFRSVAIGGCIEKELDAIHIFFLQHTITPQASRAFGSSPLNRALLDVFRNM